MQIMVECTCKAKTFEVHKLHVRSENLMPQEELDKAREHVEKAIEENAEAIVNRFIPGKHGKNTKINLVFEYGLLDRYDYGEKKWQEESEGQVHLINVELPEDKPPLIQTPTQGPPVPQQK